MTLQRCSALMPAPRQLGMADTAKQSDAPIKDVKAATAQPSDGQSRPAAAQTGLPFSLPLLTVVMGLAWIGALLTSSPSRMEMAKSYMHLDTYRQLPDRLLSHVLPAHKLTFEQWFERQERASWKLLLKNVHPPGTAEGVIVASPSRSNPDYWYTWTRDSAVVMRPLVDSLAAGSKVHSANVLAYIRASRAMQLKQTVIGGFDDGGLGEVKYHVNYEPFRGEWGRPQQDGPASRVITLCKVAHTLLNSGSAFETEFTKAVLYDSKLPTQSAIKGDLEHISRRWKEASFDLWEEVSGSHFYTLLAIKTALIDGAALARRLDDPGAADYYDQVANEITPVLESFWNAEQGIIRVTKDHAVGRDSDENAHVGDDTYGKQSGLDTAILLAVLHSGDRSDWFGQGQHADKVLSTLQHLRIAFSQVYPINANRTVPALGRYPEDKYDGYGLSRGNPWYLCTLAASELIYKTATDLVKRDSPLLITPESFAFYSSLDTSIRPGTRLEAHSAELAKLAKMMGRLGDQFANIVRQFGGTDGSLHEQFNLVTGKGQGARDLTWSYAAFVTAAQARRDLVKALRSAKRV